MQQSNILGKKVITSCHGTEQIMMSDILLSVSSSSSDEVVSSELDTIPIRRTTSPVRTHPHTGIVFMYCEIVSNILEFGYITSSPGLGRQVAFDVIGCSRS